MAAMIWQSLDDGDTMTGFGRMRRARVFDLRPLLHPNEGEGGG
jgi:hypothetical protein